MTDNYGLRRLAGNPWFATNGNFKIAVQTATKSNVIRKNDFTGTARTELERLATIGVVMESPIGRSLVLPLKPTDDEVEVTVKLVLEAGGKWTTEPPVEYVIRFSKGPDGWGSDRDAKTEEKTRAYTGDRDFTGSIHYHLKFLKDTPAK